MSKNIGEVVQAVTTCYKSGPALLLIIPKSAAKLTGIQAGDRFLLKVDGARRLIYEPQREELVASS